MLGSVFTVAVLLESITTSCSEEYCLAVQQGTNSSDLLAPLVERIFCKGRGCSLVSSSIHQFLSNGVPTIMELWWEAACVTLATELQDPRQK